MSKKEWGTFIESFRTRQEAEWFVDEQMSKLKREHPDLAHLAQFSVHPTYDNTSGRTWFFGVYVRRHQ